MKGIRTLTVEHPWLLQWPSRVAVVVSTLGNTEFFIIPIVFVAMLSLKGTTLMIASSTIATIELCYWYWYAGWAQEEEKKTRAVREAKKIVQEGIEEIRQTNTWERIENWFHSHIINLFNTERYGGFYRFLFISLKGLGWFFGSVTILIIAAIPFPFVGWAICLAACRSTGWKLWIVALFCGNALKNSVGYGWFVWSGGWRNVLQFIQQVILS